MTRFVLSVLSLAVCAACGGKAAPPTTPGDTGGGAPGAPTHDTLLPMLKASTIALPAGGPDMACDSGEPTLGALITSYEKMFAGDVGLAGASSSCEPKDGGAWHCRTELLSKPQPDCDAEAEMEGCDGTAFQVEYDLDAAGAIVPASLMCMTAG